jgi:alkanesulfonate monooxygenase SsuD/methylene tetrahydromethanopterin reductase-like flavin-dependent oxidoreductase (luciferase family)
MNPPARPAAPPPFAPGSVSVRLYPHNDLSAVEISGHLCTQGALALDGGFDGVMVSEHHGGFAGYLPNPIQTAGFILASAANGWAAPSPILLPLRPVAMAAEEVAWMDARFPGRVGLGVAAGALELDFVEMGLQLDDAVPFFKRDLPRVVAMLRGDDLGGLAGDKALAARKADPIPVLSAAMSPTAARRAAGCGAGILLEAMSTVSRQRQLCEAFDAAGGGGSKVLIRRVWLGELPIEAVEQQRRVYESYSTGSVQQHFAEDQTITSRDPAEVAERLAAVLREVGADALNLRVHLPGVAAHDARDQIEGLAHEVLPRLRDLLAPRGRTVSDIEPGGRA